MKKKSRQKAFFITLKELSFAKNCLRPKSVPLKTEILLELLRLGSKLFHSIIADGKKRIFEKVMLCLNKGNIAHSSCNIWCTSCRNKIKKVFWILIF